MSRDLEEYIIQIKHYIIEAVKEMLEQELPILTTEKFALFQTTGNRLIYEADYFAKRKFLTVFGVAAQWMKQDGMEYIGTVSKMAVLQKLEEVLYSICEEVCWALPAHVDTSDTDWHKTIDLFAAETAQSLSDIVDVMKTDLSSQCVCLVRENVQYRVLEPFFETECGTYGWEVCDNNWNAVCNGNIGSAYLHSLTENEEVNGQYLQRIGNNLLRYIDGFAKDGTCMEGLGYYFYGMTYWVNFACELYQKTNGAVDLLNGTWGDFESGKEDKRSQIAGWWSKCFFSSGRTVSFSDGDSRDKYRMGLACALAEHYSTVQLPNSKRSMLLEEDHCYRYLPFKMDLFNTMRYREVLKQNKNAIVYGTFIGNEEKNDHGRVTILQDAQWCIMEDKLHNIGFACKGGHNDEPHNHNDVGSFLYLIGSDMFLVDLGAGEYTKSYFGEGRYDVLCNRSLGHNIPLIEGREQLTGAVYECERFEAEEKGNELVITMNITKAYAVECLKSFVRKMKFNKEKGTLIIEDIFECEEEVKITENLVTQFLPEVADNSIILFGKKVCHIQLLSEKKEKQNMPRVVPVEHSNHQGEKEKVYLLQWDRVIRKQHKECFKIEIV